MQPVHLPIRIFNGSFTVADLYENVDMTMANPVLLQIIAAEKLLPLYREIVDRCVGWRSRCKSAGNATAKAGTNAHIIAPDAPPPGMYSNG